MVETSRPPWRIGVGHVALILPLCAAFVASRLPVRDNSYLWHVRAGTHQVDLGRVLTEDPFSFTALGRPWRTQSWLLDLLYGWADRRWGLSAVTAFVLVGSAALVVAASLRAYEVLRAPLLAAVGAVWVMWLNIGYFTPRPVLFSLALLAIVLVAAEHRALRWTLPLIFWVWASVHGGFVVGIGYLTLDGLRRRERNRIIDVGAAVAGTFVTAHGWGTWQVVMQFLRSTPELDLIVEWLTPDLFSLEHFPFALVLLAVVAMAIDGRFARSDLWVLGPFLLFAFTANRAVPISALVLAPWYLPLVGRLRERTSETSLTLSVVNATIGVALIGLPWLVSLPSGLDEELFGVQAVKHLGPGRLFHDDGVGGYLIYAEWPERLVYIDDRAELYGEDFADFVSARAGAPGWEDVFGTFGFEQALLKLEDPLAEMLGAQGWVEAYRDDRFVLMRQGP